MRAITKETSKIIRTSMTIIAALFVMLAILIILLIGIMSGIKRFDFIPKEYATAIQVVSFVVGGCVIVFVGCMLIASGIIVVRTIQKTSKNVITAVSEHHKSESKMSTTESQNSSSRASFDKVSFEKRVQSPFKITFGLLIGLLLCMALQLVAIAIAAGASELANYSVIWQFLNCTGVLIFGILILFLFYPLFRDMEIAMKEIEKRKETLSQKKLHKVSHLQLPLQNGSSSSTTLKDHSMSGSENNFLSLPSSSSCGDMSPTTPSTISFSTEVLVIPSENNISANNI